MSDKMHSIGFAFLKTIKNWLKLKFLVEHFLLTWQRLQLAMETRDVSYELVCTKIDGVTTDASNRIKSLASKSSRKDRRQLVRS